MHVVEFTAETPFEVQLRTMAHTDVFISVHTSNLANAQFLQPGSAVVEIIQRNWVWHNLDRSFQVHSLWYSLCTTVGSGTRPAWQCDLADHHVCGLEVLVQTAMLLRVQV